MKVLFIVRHGKAEPDSAKGDFGRDLTERGRDDAKTTGRRIAKLAGVVDAIVTSDAVRAIETARIVAEPLQPRPPMREDHSIYEAAVDDLPAVIHDLPIDARAAVIVGHNPGLEGLLYLLAADKRDVSPLKPGTVAHLELDIELWSQAREGTARIIGIHAP